MIRDTITPAARAFLATQRTVARAVDGLGRPWASLWLGAPGFVTSDDGYTMRLRYDERVVAPEDPIITLLQTGHEVGALAIDLGSRRRLRVNGAVTATTDEHIEVRVREAFPNCPKYIQRREAVPTCQATPPLAWHRGDRLDPDRRAFATSVDTLLVASRHPTRGVDVSHRGGLPGFFCTGAGRTNSPLPRLPRKRHVSDSRQLRGGAACRRVMVDFERGRYLSLTGAVKVSYDANDAAHDSGGTHRFWELALETWLEIPMPGHFAFRFIESSPHNPRPFESVP